MMTKQELIDYCLSYPAAFEDYPFDATTAVIKHSANKKMFAFVNHLKGKLQITLKCDPDKAEFLRTIFKSVTAGYHMNKKHWNTIYVEDCDVPIDELHDMIKHSYDIVKPKERSKKK